MSLTALRLILVYTVSDGHLTGVVCFIIIKRLNVWHLLAQKGKYILCTFLVKVTKKNKLLCSHLLLINIYIEMKRGSIYVDAAIFCWLDDFDPEKLMYAALYFLNPDATISYVLCLCVQKVVMIEIVATSCYWSSHPPRVQVFILAWAKPRGPHSLICFLTAVKVTAQMLLSAKCPQTQLALNPHCLKQTPEHNKWLVLGSRSMWEWSVPCSGVLGGWGESVKGWMVLISFQRDAVLWKCCSLRLTVGPLWTARMHF